MSLKGVELQIAIPKTFDAGKIAEQKQQRAVISQELANAETEKQAQKNKESVLQSEKTAKADRDNRSKEEREQQEPTEQKQQEEEKKTSHPYKGSFVDFSG